MSVGAFTRFRLHVLERSLLFAQSAANQLHRSEPRTPHIDLGERGELAAYFYLRRMGCTIIARQWRSAKLRGDLDLIAWHGETLCFVEVKTRSTRDAFPAEIAVDKEKRIMLRKMARSYLHQLENAHLVAVRFDIVSVYFDDASPQFQLFAGAFGWAEVREDRWY
jgi:putative endonuclease